MGKEIFRTRNFLLKDNKKFRPSLIYFDLPHLVEKLKLKRYMAKGDLNSMILLKTPDKQIVLTIICSGTEIESFQSNDSVTFQIIEGKLTFHSCEETVSLSKGQLMTIHQNIQYSLVTEDETVMLMTISNVELQLSVN